MYAFTSCNLYCLDPDSVYKNQSQISYIMSSMVKRIDGIISDYKPKDTNKKEIVRTVSRIKSYVKNTINLFNEYDKHNFRLWLDDIILVRLNHIDKSYYLLDEHKEPDPEAINYRKDISSNIIHKINESSNDLINYDGYLAIVIVDVFIKEVGSFFLNYKIDS